MFIKRQQLPYQQTLRFRGATLSYRVTGKGKPVILLHGSMTSEPWNGFDILLAKYYRVYLPDLPGFGASDAVSGYRHNTDLFAESLGALIQKEKLNNVLIIGCSLGAIVALKTAVRHDTKGKLVLVGTPTLTLGWGFRILSLLPLWLKRMVVATEFGRRRLLLPVLRQNIGTPVKAKKQFDEGAYQLMLPTNNHAIADPDYDSDIRREIPKLLSKVTNQTVFIYGELDPQQNNLTKYGKQYQTLPKLGHNIFAENPKKSLAVVRKYL